MPRKALLGLALIASLSAAPAHASGGIFCEGDNAVLDMATGRLMVLSVLGAWAEIEGKSWSTGPDRGEGEPFIVGQAFADQDVVMVDFTDPNIETILLSVRLRYQDSDDVILKGTMTAAGKSYTVECGEG